ncbi:MAG: hypothetical protein H5U07_00615 [Candidatus Aminicenantes bacterium]|nr:hypothetical protein [Candidatus Aminicenantes bacterium]
MKKFLYLVSALLILFSAVRADVYLRARSTTDPINAYGQNIPAREIISEQWIANDFYLQKNGDLTSTLYDIKKNKIYLIFHQSKSYLELTPPVDFASLLPEEMAQMAQALDQLTISVKPTGETKTINNINCQGYKVEMSVLMSPINMKVWASEELPFNLKSFIEKIWPEVIKLELKGNDKAMAELAKIKGLWIAYETQTQTMGLEINSRYEVVEISKKSPPPGIYSVPADYKKKDKLSMEDLQGFF